MCCWLYCVLLLRYSCLLSFCWTCDAPECRFSAPAFLYSVCPLSSAVAYNQGVNPRPPFHLGLYPNRHTDAPATYLSSVERITPSTVLCLSNATGPYSQGSVTRARAGGCLDHPLLYFVHGVSFGFVPEPTGDVTPGAVPAIGAGVHNDRVVHVEAVDHRTATAASLVGDKC